MFGKKKSKNDLLEDAKHNSPLEELSGLLDKLEAIIKETRGAYVRSIQLSTAAGSKSKRGGFLKGFGRKSEDTATTPPSTSSAKSFKFQEKSNKQRDAKFIPMSDKDEKSVVEIIRRIGELVVFAERASATQSPEMHDGDIASFNYFFERNGLALITDILTGVSFDLRLHGKKKNKALESDSSPHRNDLTHAEDTSQGFDFDLSEHKYMLLPPLSIVTQAIQSISILVQNVKHATSLFFLLSNNHINQLINFPLEQYHISDRKQHNQDGNGLSPRRQGSHELAELTTHFVTFLKSLAMRMNLNTLQFYLTYPQKRASRETDAPLSSSSDHNSQDTERDGQVDDGECPTDEIQGNSSRKALESKPFPSTKVENMNVEFPLYERALEFCSVHQDSFVRITAMNICLNTLRLVTVNDKEKDEEDTSAGHATPDGVLHNAKTLPIRERLAIAQFVCLPSRVERLTSPIFTKLAQLWGILEEQFRDMDSTPGMRKVAKYKDALSEKNSTTEKAKTKVKRQKASDSLMDTAANIQDELLLLEDLLRVGLSTLNEQTIEMMFATFVYPLLLQPLLLYFQRTTLNDSILYADPIKDYIMGRPIKKSDLRAGENSIISAPAKSAFFSLAAVFQFVTNPPLLRLLFTALFHPLAPGATGEAMIKTDPDVATMDNDGEIHIRIDPFDGNGQMITKNDRSSYAFGTGSEEKCKSSNSRLSGDPDGCCAFVLSPVLAGILRFQGDDGALVARTRNNPYRRAIFQCFTLSNQLSDLQPFSVLAVDSAFSTFDKKFLSDILFGADVITFFGGKKGKTTFSDSQLDIGEEGIGVESRFSLRGAAGTDYIKEVLSSFQSCLIRAMPGGDGLWKLEYDKVAGHALLCVIEGSPEAQKAAEEGMSVRCRQAAEFFSSLPEGIEILEGSNLLPQQDMWKNEDVKETHRDVIMNRIFGSDESSLHSILNHMYWLKTDRSQHFLSVSSRGSYNALCRRSYAFPPIENEGFDAALQHAISSARAWTSLDAYCTLLSIIGKVKGESTRQAIVGGCAIKQNGTVVPTYKTGGLTYAPISEGFAKAMFEEDKSEKTYIETKPGMVLSLVGRAAFPCVCEVPPSCAPLFSEAGAKVVSQGITWQSLYLVILGWNLVLAEPERKTSADGRVIMCCRLEDLVLEKDNDDLPPTTSARRLIVSHYGSDKNLPGMFLFENKPEPKAEGPFIRVQKWRSSVDIWFENEKAMELCFAKVDKICTMAKANRGHLILDYMKNEE